MSLLRKGLTHERFRRVALVAFSEMGEAEAAKYVEKRHKLVADVLVED